MHSRSSTFRWVSTRLHSRLPLHCGSHRAFGLQATPGGVARPMRLAQGNRRRCFDRGKAAGTAPLVAGCARAGRFHAFRRVRRAGEPERGGTRHLTKICPTFVQIYARLRRALPLPRTSTAMSSPATNGEGSLAAWPMRQPQPLLVDPPPPPPPPAFPPVPDPLDPPLDA